MTTYCTTSSLQAGEPIAGSAVSETWRFLGIEYRGRWEARAVEAAELPPSLRRQVHAFEAWPGTRVQLLRRPGRTGPLRVVYADTTPGAQRTVEIDVDDPAAVELGALVDGRVGRRRTEPLLWVCTNGRRDACCARFGAKAYHALEAELGEAVWQTTHLGGHRFAATLLALPEGLSWGRLRGDDVPALVDAVGRGVIHDLDRFRGRTAWSPPVQAAEAAVREATGVDAVGSVTLLSTEATDEEHVQVRFAVAGVGERTVQVTREPLAAPLVASCGKAPAPRHALRTAIA